MSARVTAKLRHRQASSGLGMEARSSTYRGSFGQHDRSGRLGEEISCLIDAPPSMSAAPVVRSLGETGKLRLSNRAVRAAFERQGGRQLFLHGAP